MVTRMVTRMVMRMRMRMVIEKCGWRKDVDSPHICSCEAGVREAGDVADGGDRPSTLAKGAAADGPCDLGVFFGRGCVDGAASVWD